MQVHQGPLRVAHLPIKLRDFDEHVRSRTVASQRTVKIAECFVELSGLLSGMPPDDPAAGEARIEVDGLIGIGACIGDPTEGHFQFGLANPQHGILRSHFDRGFELFQGAVRIPFMPKCLGVVPPGLGTRGADLDCLGQEDLGRSPILLLDRRESAL